MQKKLAIITGAASGIGAAFANQLASEEYDLVLIDMNKEGLEDYCEKLRGQYKLNIKPVVANLALTEDILRIQQYLESLDSVDLIINNAGFGTMGKFAVTNFDRQRDMINVHVLACSSFCRAVLPGMIARGRGGIINVCSMGAYLRFPEDATYSATKAFMLVFTEVLREELNGTGVTTQALCPGWTITNFIKGNDMKGFDPNRFPKFMCMLPEQVVSASLRAFRRGSSTYIPGILTRAYVIVFGNPYVIRMMVYYRKIREILKPLPGMKWLR